MRDNWMLVVALLVIAGWAVRFLTAGPGIGMSLWMTSAALGLAGFLLLNWWTSKRRRRRPPV